MSEPVLTKVPNPAEIRAELEAMVVGDLLGPAGGESEELTERTVRDRYVIGVVIGRVKTGHGWARENRQVNRMSVV